MTSAVTLAQYGSAGYTAGFKNRMINGDFRIWQRGTSITTTGGGYTADMWIIEPRSSQSCTISQSTDVPSGQGFEYSGRFTATGGALQGFHIRTAIENPAAGNFGEFQPGTTWTFSIWAKSAFAGVAITPIFFLSSNALSNPNASVGLNGGSQTIASTWTRYTWTVTMPTWTADAGSLSLCNQLTIRLLIGAGSQDLYITGVQMEPGTTVSSFDRRPIQMETMLSQRYYEYGFSSGSGYAQITAIFDAGAANHINFKVTKRITPSMSAPSLAANTFPNSDYSAAVPRFEGGFSRGFRFTTPHGSAYWNVTSGNGGSTGVAGFALVWTADASL
jgi:hypothetical protein